MDQGNTVYSLFAMTQMRLVVAELGVRCLYLGLQ